MSGRGITIRMVMRFLAAWVVICANATAIRAEDGAGDLRDYYSANGLLNRGLHELAAFEYRKFLSEHGKHEKAPVAKYGLGVCLYHLGKFDEAAGVLAPLRSEKEFAFAAEVATMLGQCHLELGQDEEAVKAFEHVLADHAKHVLADDAAAGAAEALYRLGSYDDVIAQCKAISQRWPDSPMRMRSTFLWALSSMQQHDYEGAAERFRELLKAHPNGPHADQASVLLAQCYHHADLSEQAVREYRRVLERAGSRFVAEALHGLGLLALQHDDPQAAGALFDKLLQDHPGSPTAASARFHRGRAWFESGDFERALESFESCGGRDGGIEADRVAYWIAKCKLREGRFAEAAGELASAVETYPQSALLAEMFYDRAVALSRAGQAAPAVEILAEFRKRFSDHELAADALWLLATIEHEQRHYDKSLAHCRVFLKTYGKHGSALDVTCLAAENEFLSGRYQDAVNGYRTCLAGRPREDQAARVRFRLGSALFHLDELEAAEPILKEVIAGDGGAQDFRFARFALGDIQFQRGEWSGAIQYFREYLAGDREVPAADDAMIKLGIALQRRGDHDEALVMFDRLLNEFAQSPHRLQAVFERGQSLVPLGRGVDAAAAFRQVVEEGGDSRFKTHALNHLGSLAMNGGDFERAAEFFEKAAVDQQGSVDPAESLFQRGQALLAADHSQEAERAFSELIERHPKHARAAEARAELAVALSRQDRYEEALAAITRVERTAFSKLSDSLGVAVQYEKAWCLKKLGRAAEAIDVYRRLLAAKAESAIRDRATVELAELEAKAGRPEAAVDLLRGLPSGGAEAAGRMTDDLRERRIYLLAVYEFELEHYSEAAELFAEFIKSFPESDLMASASYFCGEAMIKIGRHGPASVHLTRVIEQFPADPLFEPSLLRLGEATAALQEWPRSEQVFAEYIDRIKDGTRWYQAQFGLGWAREHQGRHEDAMRAYEQVVARHQGPTAARAQFQIGECLFAQGKYEDAARELLKVDILYAYPDWSAAALYEAGQCFDRLAQSGEARRQFQAVIERFDGTRWARMAAARLSDLSASALPGR